MTRRSTSAGLPPQRNLSGVSLVIRKERESEREGKCARKEASREEGSVLRACMVHA
jgi:hypothetical protein